MAARSFRLVPERFDPARFERLLGRRTRVGLRGVLADLDRAARRADVPGEAAVTGLAWDGQDQATGRWYPQGITTSADAYGSDPSAGTVDGRSVVLVSWYGRGLVGRFLGSRVSVLADVDDEQPRYRHVRLVVPRRLLGVRWLGAVRVHAGGIVWYGDHLFVAASRRGVRVFGLDDLTRLRRDGDRRYVLPQATRYRAAHQAGTLPMTYSFMALQRRPGGDHLVAGEYGRVGGSHRLVRFALDPGTGLLATGPAGVAEPVRVFRSPARRMQGAVPVGSTWVLTSSNGRGNPGDLWTGRGRDVVRHRGVLPTGPEDITWWPQRGELWTLTEWPQQRWVYAIDGARWLGVDDS